MMQELVTLCMSDIGRFLGTLGLLSLGITLTLWGLKRRRSGAVAMALFLCLAALVPTVLAIEIPPEDSYVYIQTTGPSAELTIGDWYTNSTTDGPGSHSFEIYVPCTLAPTQVITVALFDPEVYDDGTGDELDEVRRDTDHNPTDDNTHADETTFTLFDPSSTEVIRRTYVPSIDTSGQYTTLASFSIDAYGCGIYRLLTTTGYDDDNAWRLQVTPDNPDGRSGTGDEISLGNLQTSFQNTQYDCQTFHFFVPDISSIRLSNFDMDNAGTIVYTSPSGATPPATRSPDSRWNNGGESSPYPPPGGDLIEGEDFESGWWQAEFCVDVRNQYIFDTGGIPYFYTKPAVPDMSVSKDDGTTTFVPGGILTYTITYTNAGPGAALDVVLTDTLPAYTTFITCSGGLSCGEVPPPGSGIVTFQLGTIVSETSGYVTVSVRVDRDVPPGTTITNTVELDYTDILFSDYPPERDTDVDQYEEEEAAIVIAKTPDLQTVVSGSTVTFTITVTNTGSVPLTNVTVTDPLAPDCARTFASLDPGASESYICTVTNVTADFTNLATVTGTPPVGRDVTDRDQAEVDVIGPGIKIAKTPDLQTVVSGSTVTFTITVTNTGSVPLTNVTVTDPLAPDCARTFASLDPGASESYICTVTNVTAGFTNLATVTGTPPVGVDVTDRDRAEVDVIGLKPTPKPPEREPPEPEPPKPTFTPTPTSPPPTPVTPTLTVEVLTVERLPETGGFPDWFTVVLGVAILIGAASLLNLALLEMRGRRGDGRGN